MKALLIALLLSIMVSPVAIHAQDSSGGSATSTAISLGGLSVGLIGSVTASTISSGAASQGSMAVANSVVNVVSTALAMGSEVLLVSATLAGNLVYFTYRASIKGSELALQLGTEVVEFTLAVSSAALSATSSAVATSVEATSRILTAGGKIIVKTIPIIAGTALVLVGYSFQVAAVPVALSGVLLNSIGKSLVGQN